MLKFICESSQKRIKVNRIPQQNSYRDDLFVIEKTDHCWKETNYIETFMILELYSNINDSFIIFIAVTHKNVKK